MPPEAEAPIYLLIALADYARAVELGRYEPPGLATEHFIHASPADQLTRVANKHYRGVKDLHLLCVDPRRVRAPVRWEPAAGGLYPHIYGPLNLDAVLYLKPIVPGAGGEFRIDPQKLEGIVRTGRGT
jgi:uncharacterized protein (DUF952 family)